ncbi:MAG: UDP-N-acetylmuramoyl-L-alanine--D-glutamate ligase [Hyphomonas sp.]
MADLAALVLSPGILKFPQPHRIVRMAEMTGVPVVGDMELFARAVQALPERGRPKIVGITGTNGKSTTTALIGHILKQAGRDARIGGTSVPACWTLPPCMRMRSMCWSSVSYQLDLVKSLHCDVAVLLNMSPDHLDRHGGMEGYQAAKMRIFQNQTERDTAVIGFDDVITQSIAIGLSARGPARVVQVSSSYALGRGVSAVDGRLYDSNGGNATYVGNLAECVALPGKHNHQNAVAAYAACRALGLDHRTIMAGLISFPGLAHRMERVGEIEGIRFVNDSKATNAQAAEQALKAYENIYWIAGGVPKSDGIAPLTPYFPRITKAYLIGEAEDAFAATLKGKVATQSCGTLENAVQAAFRDARNAGTANPVILLSPACASFDQFRDFEHRGDVFRSIVESMMPTELREMA